MDKCRGSLILGTACGRCARCKEKAAHWASLQCRTDAVTVEAQPATETAALPTYDGLGRLLHRPVSTEYEMPAEGKPLYDALGKPMIAAETFVLQGTNPPAGRDIPFATKAELDAMGAKFDARFNMHAAAHDRTTARLDRLEEREPTPAAEEPIPPASLSRWVLTDADYQRIKDEATKPLHIEIEKLQKRCADHGETIETLQVEVGTLKQRCFSRSEAIDRLRKALHAAADALWNAEAQISWPSVVAAACRAAGIAARKAAAE